MIQIFHAFGIFLNLVNATLAAHPPSSIQEARLSIHAALRVKPETADSWLLFHFCRTCWSLPSTLLPFLPGAQTLPQPGTFPGIPAGRGSSRNRAEVWQERWTEASFGAHTLGTRQCIWEKDTDWNLGLSSTASCTVSVKAVLFAFCP